MAVTHSPALRTATHSPALRTVTHSPALRTVTHSPALRTATHSPALRTVTHSLKTRSLKNRSPKNRQMTRRSILLTVSDILFTANLLLNSKSRGTVFRVIFFLTTVSALLHLSVQIQ